MRLTWSRLCAALLPLGLAAPAASAAERPSVDSVLDALNRVHELRQAALSPDGRRIAILYTAGSTQPHGALVAYRPDAGVVEEKVDEQRIALVDVDTGALREVSPPDLYVYDYDWSPDGRRLVAEAAYGSGTNNYWIAALFVVA